MSPSKELALELAHKTHHFIKYKAHSDGSRRDRGVGTSAILFKYDKPPKIKRYHLGPQTKHTVYKAELVGIILTISLLTDLTSQITGKALIGLDNQASIYVLNDQSAKPSHYLLDHIHSTTETLQQKQDKIHNAATFKNAKCSGNLLIAQSKGIFNL